MSNKCRAYSESKLGLEPPDNRKAFYAGWDAALRAALAEPTCKASLPVEPVQAWHFIDCEGECLACLIEREVKATYGNQGLAHLRRHVGGNNESA